LRRSIQVAETKDDEGEEQPLEKHSDLDEFLQAKEVAECHFCAALQQKANSGTLFQDSDDEAYVQEQDGTESSEVSYPLNAGAVSN
jgi:hypothetical protein